MHPKAVNAGLVNSLRTALFRSLSAHPYPTHAHCLLCHFQLQRAWACFSSSSLYAAARLLVQCKSRATKHVQTTEETGQGTEKKTGKETGRETRGIDFHNQPSLHNPYSGLKRCGFRARFHTLRALQPDFAVFSAFSSTFSAPTPLHLLPNRRTARQTGRVRASLLLHLVCLSPARIYSGCANEESAKDHEHDQSGRR